MGYITREDIIIFNNIIAVYTTNPDNRRSILIIKTISVVGKTIPPVLII